MLYSLIVGGIAGWLASTFMKGEGMGILMNIILGIVGAFVGAWVLPMLGVTITGGMLGQIFRSTCGAVLVLFIVGAAKK